MIKSSFLLVLLFLIVSRWSYAQEKPNIVLIVADDLGYGDLGCYGQKKIKTPNIDRMAQQGMKFLRHYAGSTVCAPSRAVLMTGLHTGHVSVKGNGDLPLRPNESSVAQLLKMQGYQTGIIGKWGLGQAGSSSTPPQKGFDYFFGFLHHVHAHNHFPDFLWRNDERVPLQNTVEVRRLKYTPEPGGVARERYQYANDLFTEEALSFIQRQGDSPFFLYLAYTLPHANNEANPGEEMEVPSAQPYENEVWPKQEKNKAAMITRLDQYVGKILDQLSASGLDSNTVVIFTSDNGPHKEGVDPEFFDSNGSLRGIKRDLYEGGIRVPFVVRWPDQVKAGTTSDHISAFWDIVPTLTEIAGASMPAQSDGISFVPSLRGESSQPVHSYLYWEFNEGGEQFAVRSSDWKLVSKKDKTGNWSHELYDLARDEVEARNVAAQNPAVIDKLLNYAKDAQR